MNYIIRLSLIITVVMLPVMLLAQAPIIIGPVAPAISATSNATATSTARITNMFTPNGSKTISKVRLYMSVLTGTPAATDYQLDIFASSEGKPTGSSLATAVGTVTPAGLTWQEWTGLSLAVTADVPYHLVIRNLHATPASNNVSWRALQFMNHIWGGGGLAFSGVSTSTDSGSTWSVQANMLPVYRIEYSDGSFQGIPYVNYVTVVDANFRVYGTRSWGGRFTTPANGQLNVSHCAFSNLRGTGTPTGVRCRIYQLNTGANTATSVATSVDYPLSTYSSATATPVAMLRLSSVYTLQPSTEYIMAIESTNTGDSSSNYSNGLTWTVDNSSASLALTPFNGTLRNVHCTGTCTTWSNWTQTDTSQPGMALVLSYGNEFTSSGGAAGGSYVYVK